MPVAPTVRGQIDAAARLLQDAGVVFGHGTTNARDEASWLVLWSLGLPLDTDPDDPHAETIGELNTAQCERISALVLERITSRKPAAYLTGEAWLAGVPFTVDERVIVPRSLIAELLTGGDLDYWLGEHTQRVLDLCTGNASLAILAAMTYPDVVVDGTDISTDALEVAAINVARHGLRERITLLHSNALQAVRGPYDLILCNPPYVNAASMARLPAEYRAEPRIALDGNTQGGADGMDFVRDLLRNAPSVLSGHGVLVLEIGNEREHFESAFAALEAVWLETSAGQDQVLLLTLDALNP